MFYSAVICGPELCKQDGMMKMRVATNIIAYPATSHGIWRFIPHRGDYILRSEAEWDI